MNDGREDGQIHPSKVVLELKLFGVVKECAGLTLVYLQMKKIAVTRVGKIFNFWDRSVVCVRCLTGYDI